MIAERKRGPQRSLAVHCLAALEQQHFYRIGRIGARLGSRRLRPMLGVRR